MTNKVQEIVDMVMQKILSSKKTGEEALIITKRELSLLKEKGHSFNYGNVREILKREIDELPQTPEQDNFGPFLFDENGKVIYIDGFVGIDKEKIAAMLSEKYFPLKYSKSSMGTTFVKDKDGNPLLYVKKEGRGKRADIIIFTMKGWPNTGETTRYNNENGEELEKY